LLNLDTNTLKFAHPLSAIYLDKPSPQLIEQIVQGARRLTAPQVPEFVGLAAAILKKYKTRQDNNKDADAVCLFSRSIVFSSFVVFFLENKRISNSYCKIFK
jgi:hypothetical protein